MSFTPKEKQLIFAMYTTHLCHIDAGMLPERILPIVGALPNGKVIVGDFSIQLVEMVDCTILLTPLKEITDEHAIEVAKIAMRMHNRHFEESEISYEIIHRNKPYQVAGVNIDLIIKGERRYVVQIMDDSVAIRGHRDNSLENDGWMRRDFHTPNQYEIADFLRENGYALPYKGKDLFNERIAAEKSLYANHINQ